MNVNVWSTNELLGLFSPSTLVFMLIADADIDMGASGKMLSLERDARAALAANVGEEEAARMLSENGVTT